MKKILILTLAIIVMASCTPVSVSKTKNTDNYAKMHEPRPRYLDQQ